MSRRIMRWMVVGLGSLMLGAGCDGRNPAAPGADQATSRSTTTSQLTTFVNTPGAIHLDWPDQVSNESGWEVHRSSTGATGTFTLVASLPANSSGHSDVQLASKTEYCYKVRSFRTTGRKQSFAAFSNVACATTAGEPPAPSVIEAVPVHSFAVSIWWSDESQLETGFRLERAAVADGPWTTLATLSVGRTAYDHDGVPGEQTMCYRVIAFNTVGTSPPSPVDCTAPPARPTDLSAAAADARSIDLRWTDASAVEDGYQIERSRDERTWSSIAVLPSGATFHRDTGLTGDTRYFHRVRALRDGGGGSFSTPASATTIASPPPAPSSASSWAQGSSVTIHWATASHTTESFRIERSSDGASGWEIAVIAASDQRSAQDPDRPLEQRVCYRVIAVNRIGTSAPSPVACSTPLAAPTDFAIARTGDGGLLLTWHDASLNNTVYYLEYLRIWYGGFYGYYAWWEQIALLDGIATSYRATDLDQTLPHRFRLYARSNDAISAPTPEVEEYTTEPLAAPSNLDVWAVGTSYADLTWTDNSPDETMFHIEICVSEYMGSCLDWSFANVEANRTTHRVEGLQPDATYSFRVRAATTDRLSRPSNVAYATTRRPE